MPFRIKLTLIAFGSLLAAVLVLPLAWPVAPLQDTEPVTALAAADANWIPAADVRLHARILGPSAAPEGAALAGVAFVHGFGSNLASFGPLQRTFASDLPTVAYDRPGFGLSERPLGHPPRVGPYSPGAQVEQLLAVLDEAVDGPALVVGHSAGARIALDAALAAPDRFAALVLIGPATYRGGGPRFASWALATPQMRRIGPALMRQLGGEAGEGLLRGAYADPERILPEVLEAHHAAARAHEWDRALWEVVRAAREPRYRAADLADLTLPVLVLHGEADEVVPLEDSERLTSELGDARMVVLPGCGHVAHEECPAAVADEIAAWLAEVASQTVGSEVGARR